MPEENRPSDPSVRPSRRAFLKGASAAAAGQTFAAGALAAQDEDAAATGPERLSGATRVTLTVNGEPRELEVEPRTTLLSALRHRLEPPLTGAKEVCDRGNCGACTVLVDGRPAYACLQLACTLEGRAVTTVEGLGSVTRLSRVQRAFCARDGQMCGFCTPGFVVAATACVDKHDSPDLDTVRRELSGNLCRCGTYPHVFEAVLEASATRRGEGGR